MEIDRNDYEGSVPVPAILSRVIAIRRVGVRLATAALDLLLLIEPVEFGIGGRRFRLNVSEVS